MSTPGHGRHRSSVPPAGRWVRPRPATAPTPPPTTPTSPAGSARARALNHLAGRSIREQLTAPIPHQSRSNLPTRQVEGVVRRVQLPRAQTMASQDGVTPECGFADTGARPSHHVLGNESGTHYRRCHGRAHRRRGRRLLHQAWEPVDSPGCPRARGWAWRAVPPDPARPQRPSTGRRSRSTCRSCT